MIGVKNICADLLVPDLPGGAGDGVRGGGRHLDQAELRRGAVPGLGARDRLAAAGGLRGADPRLVPRHDGALRGGGEVPRLAHLQTRTVLAGQETGAWTWRNFHIYSDTKMCFKVTIFHGFSMETPTTRSSAKAK